MKILRNSIYNLWLDIVEEVLLIHLNKDISTDPIFKKELELVGAKIWELMNLCQEDFSYYSGRIFKLAWGSCNVTNADVANILNSGVIEFDKPKKNITKDNVKKNLHDIRKFIKKSVMEKAKDTDWEMHLKKGSSMHKKGKND